MKKKQPRKKTTDGSALLRNRYLDGRPDRIALLGQVRANDAVGRKIYQLRIKAELSQRDLAKLINTTASVICRLEDADYQGHSLAMLHRIAEALDREVEINFVKKKRAA